MAWKDQLWASGEKGHSRQAAEDRPQVSTCTQVTGRGLLWADERKEVPH